MSVCIKIDDRDNVGTLLEDVADGEIRILGTPALTSVVASEPIRFGHKVALKNLPTGEPIIKYGVRIGHATREICQGSWVHLHNTASDYDERSTGYDVDSGVPADTENAYE